LKRIFWSNYDDVEKVKFSDDLFNNPPQNINYSFQMLNEWNLCKGLFDKSNELLKSTMPEEKIKQISDKFDAKKLFKLKNRSSQETLRKNINFHLRFNLIPLLDSCTSQTQNEVLKKAYSMGAHSVLLIYLAAKKFINEKCIQNLVNNYCVVEENEAEDFVKSVRETISKVKTYKDLVVELGLDDFYNNKNSEIRRFLQSIVLAADQKYFYYPIQINVRKKFSNKVIIQEFFPKLEKKKFEFKKKRRRLKLKY